VWGCGLTTCSLEDPSTTTGHRLTWHATSWLLLLHAGLDSLHRLLQLTVESALASLHDQFEFV